MDETAELMENKKSIAKNAILEFFKKIRDTMHNKLHICSPMKKI
jgi:hypothetical protein